MSMKTDLGIIGSTEYVEIAGIKKVPAKVDTGADSSAVWASNINMTEDGVLSFTLFGEKSPLYTGERIETKDFVARMIRSSHGDVQIRYKVKLPLKILNKRLEATFTLANRSRNSFPILIGRQLIEGNYLVDVSKTVVARKNRVSSKHLNQELKENPLKFHQKYINSREK